MPDEKPTVYIVDDDPDFRESMSLMVRSMGLNAAVYPSAEAFLVTTTCYATVTRRLASQLWRRSHA